MAGSITHAKQNNIAAWTQTDLDAQIALGNFPPGTLIADIWISTDYNDGHVFTLTTADIPASTDKNYVTDAELAVLVAVEAGKKSYGTFTSTNSTTGTEQFIEITSGTFALTLTSPTVAVGQCFTTMFKNSGAGTCTLTAAAGIDSGTTFSLGAGAATALTFNGTKWLIG